MTAQDDITDDHKTIATHVATVFGGQPRVIEYADAAEQRFVGILIAPDRPVEDVTAYSTIKLSDHGMRWEDGEFPARIELAGACVNGVERFPNLLATAAFHIMQTDAVYRPGTVIEDLVREVGVSDTLPHLYFTAPFLWGDAFDELQIGTKTVTWLLAMPVSEAELQYLREHGDAALESLFEAQRVDPFDPARPSAV